MFHLPDMILNDTKNGKHVGIIFINLKKNKTFDTLHHKILLDKMKSIDFTLISQICCFCFIR